MKRKLLQGGCFLICVLICTMAPPRAAGKEKEPPPSKVVSVAWVAVPVTSNYTGTTGGSQQTQCYGQGWSYDQWQNLRLNCQTFGSPPHDYSYSQTDVYIYQAIMAGDGSRGWIMSCNTSPRSLFGTLPLPTVPLASRCYWLKPDQTFLAKIGHDKIEVFGLKTHADGTPVVDKHGKPKGQWSSYRIVTMMDAKQFREENHGPDIHGSESPNPQRLPPG